MGKQHEKNKELVSLDKSKYYFNFNWFIRWCIS